MAREIHDAVNGVDRSMKLLRDAMKGIQIRTAGFKKDHDELARAVSDFTVTLIDAEALLGKDHPARKRRR